jgi:hypothetical protein
MPALTRIELRLLLVAGAVGTGVHAAIAPEHLREWPPLGASFVAVAALLASTVVALAVRPDDERIVAALALLLGGVAVAYVATRLVPIPPLDPEREPFDALGLCTSAIEALGAIVAVHFRPPRLRLTPAHSSGGRP